VALDGAPVAPGEAAPPPAIAARLANAGSDVHRQVGTLFDLARRGVVAVRKSERGGVFHRKAYEIQPRDLGVPMLPFEQEVLRLAIGDDPAPAPREFSSFLNRVASSGRGVEELIGKHMIALGLLDPERIRTRRRWQVGSALATLLGAAAAVLGAALSAGAVRSGPAATVPFFATVAGIGVAALLIGVAGLVVSSNISPLTPRGAAAAAPARELRHWVRDIAAGGSTGAPDDFERWLPFAFAFGSGAAWVRHFRKRGETPLPEWFQADGADLDGFAFFDFVSASASSVDASAGGGGDGGGGSGGGSSSAG